MLRLTVDIYLDAEPPNMQKLVQHHLSTQQRLITGMHANSKVRAAQQQAADYHAMAALSYKEGMHENGQRYGAKAAEHEQHAEKLAGARSH